MLARNRRQPPATGKAGKEAAAVKKRAPLTNITNQKGGGSRATFSSSSTSKILVPCAVKVAKTEPPASTHDRSFTSNASSASLDPKFDVHSPAKTTSLSTYERVRLSARSCPAPKRVENELVTPVADLPPGNGIRDTSPFESADSISVCTTTSTFDSLGTPEFEYIDDEDSLSTKSIKGTPIDRFLIHEEPQTSGSIRTGDVLDMEMFVKNKLKDTQFRSAIASDIYEHLRSSELRRRPSIDFMERVQKDINSSMRTVLIDWLVEVSEEFRLVPETLFLSVNYIDRYLSGNPINRQRLQLLGVACMMIATKYEEVHPPTAEDFCFITDNTYCKEEVLQMESLVLGYLKFEMTAPTADCFLRWFVWAAHGFKEATLIQLECLAYYLAELSLLDYGMLCYAPSLVAASAVFLAKFMLSPSKKPWNSRLGCYTLYRPSDLYECVKALHRLCRSGHIANVTAVRQKYSQHKYKFVAKKYCPRSIPGEFFED